MNGLTQAGGQFLADEEIDSGRSRRVRPLCITHKGGCFKSVDQLQGQGGPLNLTGGTYGIFSEFNSMAQRRLARAKQGDWALDALLKLAQRLSQKKE